LHNHEKAVKHKNKLRPQGQSELAVTKTVKNNNIDNATKKVELEMAVCVACRCAVLSVDHFSELITRNSQGSVMGKMKLHRTKCAGLIKNVIAPQLKEELISDLKDKYYSLIIDESTDVSTEKHLCLMVRFVSNKNYFWEQDFLDFSGISFVIK